MSSYLAFPPLPFPKEKRRSVSVALSRRLPAADVISYPRPMKPGLSSPQYLSASCGATVRPSHTRIIPHPVHRVKHFLCTPAGKFPLVYSASFLIGRNVFGSSAAQRMAMITAARISWESCNLHYKSTSKSIHTRPPALWKPKS